jgi:ESCRT-II complex subunit VPS36
LGDLPRFTNPQINLLTLPSSLKVLHTPHYSTQALLSRLLNRLNPTSSSDMDEEIQEEKEKSISVIELASIENLAIGMTSELLESVEMTRKEFGVIGGVSGIVRDDQAGGGVRWYRDLISEWHIDPL